MKKDKKGFSLIEISVVLALFALVVTLTIANVSFLDKSVISADIDKLYSTCRYLQQCAMLSNEKQTLQCDIAGNQYCFNDQIETLSPQVHFGIIEHVKGPPSSPKKTISSAVTFKSSTIIFHPDGIISPGTIYLVDNKRNHLYALSSSVAHVSYLRKYLYDGKKWTQLS